MASNVTGSALLAKFPAYIQYKYDGKTYKVAGPTAKFVAVIMADSCNPDGRSACRGISSICEMTGYTRPTVISALRGLAALGVIKHRGVNSFYRTNSYDVNVQKLIEMTEATNGAELQESSDFTDSKMDGKVDSKMDGKATLLNPLTITLNPEQQQQQRTQVFTIYEQNIGALTPMLSQELMDIETEYPEGWFAEAVKEAVDNNVRNLKYVKAILLSWKKNGYKTDTRQKKDKRPVSPGGKPQPAPERITAPEGW